MAFALYLTSKCNLKCKYCFNWDQSSSIPFENAKKILTDAKNVGYKYLTLTGGEPFLYPEITEILEYTDQLGFWTTVLTNGTCLSQIDIKRLRSLSHLRVRVSLDGADAVTIDALRGKGSFDSALKGLRSLLENGIWVGIGYTYNNSNQNQLRDAFKLAVSLNCLFFRVAPIVRIRNGRSHPIDADINMNLLKTIVALSIEWEEKIFWPEHPEVYYNPPHILFMRACMAGRGYSGIDPEGFLQPCALLKECTELPRIAYDGERSFDELKERMKEF